MAMAVQAANGPATPPSSTLGHRILPSIRHRNQPNARPLQRMDPFALYGSLLRVGGEAKGARCCHEDQQNLG